MTRPSKIDRDLQATRDVCDLWARFRPDWDDVVASGLSFTAWCEAYERLAGVRGHGGAIVLSCLRVGVISLTGAPRWKDLPPCPPEGVPAPKGCAHHVRARRPRARQLDMFPDQTELGV